MCGCRKAVRCCWRRRVQSREQRSLQHAVSFQGKKKEGVESMEVVYVCNEGDSQAKRASAHDVGGMVSVIFLFGNRSVSGRMVGTDNNIQFC